MATQQQDGGEVILQAFRNLGINYVFSSPGSEWSAVWEALARQHAAGLSGPDYINCGHETLAVDLAIGYSAITGRMQAVLLHAGTGLLQGAMGVNAARLSATPMLLMSGESLTYGDDPAFDPGAQWYGFLGVTGGPQRWLEPLVKWANQATSPATLYDMTVRAGELALRTPAGPTYLNVPIETLVAPCRLPARIGPVPRPTLPHPPAEAIARLAAALVAARNPVIVTESAGRDVAGYEALLALAERLAIPVIESAVATVTNFPKDNPLHQGFDVEPWLDNADLMLLVRNRAPWYPPSRSPRDARVVVLDEQPFKTWMVHQVLHADEYLEGDVPAALRQLCRAVDALQPDAAPIARRRNHYALAHAKAAAVRAEAVANARRDPALRAIDVCATLAEVLPANTIYLDETTSQRGLNYRYVEFRGPHSFIRVPSGLGQCLGVGLGIKLAAPERPVVCLVGDGSFLYNPAVPALALARDRKLPILVLVFNNHGYRSMASNHRSFYPEGAAQQHKDFRGEAINGVNWDELAAPFAALGLRVRTAAELRPALEAARLAMTDGRSVILNAEIAIEAPRARPDVST